MGTLHSLDHRLGVLEIIPPGHLRIARHATGFDRRVELFCCARCLWMSAVRDRGGGFLPYEQWYSPLSQTLFALCGFWRMGLSHGELVRGDRSYKGPDAQALELELYLNANCVQFDRAKCPQCGDTFPEAFKSIREKRSNAPNGGAWLSDEWLSWWNQRIGNEPSAKGLIVFEAS